MPRRIIPIVSGEIYHVFNRGVDRRDVFLDKQDYLRFYQSAYLFNSTKPVINFLSARDNEKKDTSPLVEVHAYSLLPNHFHMLLRPHVDSGLSEFMKRVLGGYTSYFNEKYERSGALFQGTYKRVHIKSDEQYRYLFSYVNENHFVHGIKRDNEVIYSSSPHYQRQAQSKLIRIVRSYNAQEEQQLALGVYNKRKLIENEVFE